MQKLKDARSQSRHDSRKVNIARRATTLIAAKSIENSGNNNGGKAMSKVVTVKSVN